MNSTESPTWSPGAEPGSLSWLVAIMKELLSPRGCPWDREQTLQTLRRFLLEECYEVLDAIDEGDTEHHREELGDLLFQIVFQAELAGATMGEVIRGIGDKLIRRHPHVFGDVSVNDSNEVLVNWERIKAKERGPTPRSALAGVPRSMPALQRSQQILTRATRTGFDFDDAAEARKKIDEELREADHASAEGVMQRIEDEVGDLIFATVAWARKLGVDAERALAGSARRFETRFEALEEGLRKERLTVDGCTKGELLRRWKQARSSKGGSRRTSPKNTK